MAQPKTSFFDKIRPHKFKILGGVLGALVFAGAVFGAYKLGERQVQLPGLVATPTPLPSEAPAKEGDPTANWKTYTSQFFDFDLKYMLKYPPTWKEFPHSECGGPFFAPPLESTPPEEGSYWVVICPYIDPTKEDLAEVYGKESDLLSREEILVGNYPAIKLVFRKETMIFVGGIPGKLPKTVGIFSYDKTNQLGDQYAETVNLMLSTFKFLE